MFDLAVVLENNEWMTHKAWWVEHGYFDETDSSQRKVSSATSEKIEVDFLGIVYQTEVVAPFSQSIWPPSQKPAQLASSL